MQIVGSIICGFVALRLAVSVVGALQERSAKSKRSALAMELMRRQIDAANALRSRREHEQESWAGFRKFQVSQKVIEAEGVCSFYFKPIDRKKLAPFQPGQYLTLRLEIPGEAKPVIRCYSLSDAPDEEHYRITVKRVPAPIGQDVPAGLVSNYLHDNVRFGDIVDAQAPRGHFTLDPHAIVNPVVLIGGGVGITPVFCMAKTALQHNPKRKIWLFYGVRSRRDHALREQITEMVEDYENFHVYVAYSEPDEGDVPGEYGGYDVSGHVSVDFIKSKLKVNNFEFNVCGPPPMMSSIVSDLKKWGVPDHRIFTEAFGPATVKKVTKPPAAAVATESTSTVSLKVVFSKSEKTCVWTEDSGNLLDFAMENGVSMNSGCRAGNCGTCEVAVKSGQVKYNLECGAEPAGGVCLACVAVPQGDLVLDA